MRYKKNKSAALVALIDLILVGVLLCTFSLFHHVIPAMQSKKASAERQAAASAVTAEATPEPVPSPEIPETGTDEPEDAEPETEPEPEPVVDNRTEWQKKFEDKFTDEVVITDHSYTSPNVSINIDTFTETGDWPLVYYVADIYIGDISNFATGTANNEMVYYATQDIFKIDSACNAIISIDGDFFGYQTYGVMIRNGETYAANSNYNDELIMYYDGSMEIIKSRGYDYNEVASRDIYQAWCFGPSLLNDDGTAKTNFSSTSETVRFNNPRSAVGYYEPGHYCFIVCDGRNNAVSKGMTLPMLAKVFEELGCTIAYNMDGGGSAMMLFNHEKYSVPSNGGDRKLSDIILIRDPEYYE